MVGLPIGPCPSAPLPPHIVCHTVCTLWTLTLTLGLSAPPPPQSTRRVCTLDPNPGPACPPPPQSTRRVYKT